MLYFGRWSKQTGGHFPYNERGEPAYGDFPPEFERGRKLDSRRLSPSGDVSHLPDALYYRDQQTQGKEYLHHFPTSDGIWTVLAIWDRTADSRYGSLSSFVSKGQHTAEAMWKEARKRYPRITGRIASAGGASPFAKESAK